MNKLKIPVHRRNDEKYKFPIDNSIDYYTYNDYQYNNKVNDITRNLQGEIWFGFRIIKKYLQ